MRISYIYGLLALLLLNIQTALGTEVTEIKDKPIKDVTPIIGRWIVPIASFGFCYPQGVDFSGGVFIPLKENNPQMAHPLPISSPALRIEAAVSFYAEGIAGGITIPISNISMLTLKKERLFKPAFNKIDTFFDGYVIEYAGGGEAKFGLGKFKETKSSLNSPRSFIYFFIGFGV